MSFPKVRRFMFDEGVTFITNYLNYPFKIIPIPIPEVLPASAPDFRLIRPVMNLEVESENNSGEPISRFEFPMMVRVRYTTSDFNAVHYGRRLWLGYYNGDKWVRLSMKKHNYQLLPDCPDQPELGGVGIALIEAWDDPMIAWGD